MSELVDVDDTDVLLIESLWVLDNPRTVWKSVFRKGKFCVCGVTVDLNKVLFDSGALQRSYVSKEVVDANQTAWKDAITPFESSVRLADQRTQINTSAKVSGVLSFVGSDLIRYEGNVEAVVWSSPGIDFILGLPDIVNYFLELFAEMLKESTVNVNSVCEVIEWDAPVWSNGSAEIAPEELDTPDPCSFSSVLAYMEVPYEQAKEEYFAMLPDHIGPALKDNAEILRILTSELAVDRFVPRSWTGIAGFPPLEI